MKPKHTFAAALLILVAVFFSACNDSTDSAAGEPPDRAAIAGVYRGIFPCEDCAGIDSSLWLRADGRYFFRQRYPADEQHEAMDAFSLGRWRWLEGESALELRGSGPVRVFEQRSVDTLDMRSNSELRHHLVRDMAAGRFTASLPMSGTVERTGETTFFTECLTGLRVPLTSNSSLRRFQHQQRGANTGGSPAFVKLEGHFSWAADNQPAAVTIDRFITVKEDGGC